LGPVTIIRIVERAFSAEFVLKDLSFEDGVSKIGVAAFMACFHVEKAAFPASLVVLEAQALQNCNKLREITFAVGSQLQYIRSEAFSNCLLNEVAIPASIVEIDLSVFDDDVWRNCVRFESQQPFVTGHDFIRSLDSRIIFRFLWRRKQVPRESNIKRMDAIFGSCPAISGVRRD
jgi:hypothetical protein